MVDKWQGYLLGNYKFYWSQIWDLAHFGKEVAFMCSIWHKAVAVNEWRAQIALASIFKYCVFCNPNMSVSVKHTFWDCIQAWRAWWWAILIMHDLCGVRTGNHDSFHWSEALLGERIPKKFVKKMKIWHLLHGITLFELDGMARCSIKNNSTNPK